MTRSKLTRVVPVLALAVGAGACDDGWTDLTSLNDNPNGPGTVPAAFVLTEGMQEAADNILGNSFNMDYGEHLAQHFAEIAYAEEDIYVYRGNEIDGLFRETYADHLMDFQRVIELGQESGDPNVEAAGRIMKSWVFQTVTDLWGDVPYTEALTGDSIITPVYDPQQQVYAGILADLTAAAGMIDTGADPLGDQDLIYGGDMALWQKFANSLRLRAAMRMSEVDPTTAAAEFTAALAAPGGVFTSSADNAEICYGAVTRSPWFSYFEGRRNDYRVSATLIDTLQSFDDPRLAIYAQPAETSGEFVGMPNGRLDGHGFAPGGTSLPGTYFLSQDACLPIMTYEEVLFLRAEAAARGWTGENAEQLYYDAITASMEHWDSHDTEADISSAEISAYLAQPRVAWSGDWRQQIGLQKWLALYAQGLEAYAEVRRLNVPTLEPGPGAVLEDQIPARYPYPLSENTFNDANLSAALERQGMSSMNEQTVPVWWDAN